jgi:hypothetical protein
VSQRSDGVLSFRIYRHEKRGHQSMLLLGEMRLRNLVSIPVHPLGWADPTGLHRQSELTVKEPFRVMFSKMGGKTVVDVIGLGGSFVPAEEEDEGKDGDGDDEAEEGKALGAGDEDDSESETKSAVAATSIDAGRIWSDGDIRYV